MKAHAGLRQPVDIRRAYLGVPVASDHVGAELLGHNQNDVGTLRQPLASWLRPAPAQPALPNRK